MNWYYFRVSVLKHMDMESNSNTLFSPQNDRTCKFTPRELIKYHIEHPEVPITDKDIENLVIDLPIASSLNEEYQAVKKGSDTSHLNNNNNFNKLMQF